ncbi:hypothetical protein FE257_012668 [Aspergillus nanangensis]|uniref:Uncharacterized protein n=1 Tax=Aspergillus nanangensis TaxID=2582783 RepID=A0AAD4GQN3_ASPNN|nr:hypothetical protein FE257_012668 [Aspergillus nanangensis]
MDYFKSEKTVPIPTKDMISWLFEDQKYSQDQPIWIDASDPSRSISSRQARCMIPHELAHHLRTSKAKFVVAEPEILKSMLEAAEECNLPGKNIFIFDVVGQPVPPGFVSWRQLMQNGEQDWVRFDNEHDSKTTTAARMFSSGTTGLPKAAVITHYNLVAQHTLVFEINEPTHFKASSYLFLIRFEFPGPNCLQVRRLHVLPEFHMAAVIPAHVGPLRGISTVTYVMRRFDLEPYLAYVERYKITDLIVVPPLVISVIMSPLSKKYSIKSVTHAICGAAPLDKGVQSRFRELLAPDANFTQVWGMTESTCCATRFPLGEDDTTASIGRVIPNMEAMLIDDDGQNISNYNVRGEICIRGPCVIPGYYENAQANMEAFTPDGWFKTGDVAYCDGHSKKWYIVDRKKELIKVRGFQVAPLEIEGVLIAHPGIMDVAVIGVQLSPDESELPRAYVVRRPGVGDSLSEKEVKRYSSQRLAKYKNLDGGVVFVDAIPKNATGKAMKRELREMAKAEIKAVGESKL